MAGDYVPTKYLLSIDGGGIRGIIPATALVKRGARDHLVHRRRFRRRHADRRHSSSAHCGPVPETRTRDFSPRQPWNTVKRLATGYLNAIPKLNQIVCHELGEAAQWALNDSPIDVPLTAKGVEEGHPWYFVRDNSRNSRVTGRLKLADGDPRPPARWWMAESVSPGIPCTKPASRGSAIRISMCPATRWWFLWAQADMPRAPRLQACMDGLS